MLYLRVAGIKVSRNCSCSNDTETTKMAKRDEPATAATNDNGQIAPKNLLALNVTLHTHLYVSIHPILKPLKKLQTSAASSTYECKADQAAGRDASAVQAKPDHP